MITKTGGIARNKAFFGLHFDLHPNASDTELGADLSQENLGQLLKRVGPDYVQYDCKGHAGYTGYATQIGWTAPGIVNDSLAMWRKVTRENDVKLLVHYSGVWDIVALKHNPQWAVVNTDGKPDPNASSTFGPYVRQLMIPQLKEVCEKYDLDGAWIDGDCWAARLDWSPAALAAWKEQTGLDEAPKCRGEPHWRRWKDFHRQQFEKYLVEWIDALHQFDQSLQITSNWMYSTFAPKPVIAKVDFLSGDYSANLSVDRARVEARYLSNSNMPWDLMAWGFVWNGDSSYPTNYKTALHLQQEISQTLMQGGGVQVYYSPTRRGYIVPEIIDTMEQVSQFCRARQKICFKSTTIPQVALLCSTEGTMELSDSVFAPWGVIEEVEGVLHALLESQLSVDLLAEHQLQDTLQNYPLLVLPDWPSLTDDFRRQVVNYVEQGGALLLLGARVAKLFEQHLGASVTIAPEPPLEPAPEPGQPAAPPKPDPRLRTFFLHHEQYSTIVSGLWADVQLRDAQPLAQCHPTRDTRRGGQVAGTIKPLGKGKIAAIYGPISRAYMQNHHPVLRRLISQWVSKLFAEPMVQVKSPSGVEIALRKSAAGKMCLHLLNTQGMPVAPNRAVIDIIPPAGPIEIQWRLPVKPKRMRWLPDAKRIKWSYQDGVAHISIGQLEIHGVLVAELPKQPK